MGENTIGDQVIAVRMPDDLIERIELRVDAENAKNPGYNITRGDVIRALLLKGLETIDH